MDPLVLSSALQSGINVAGNIFSALDSNKQNMELAKYQNAFNLEMWNRQNEYNSPKAVMQRLVDAGINPRDTNGLQSYANASNGPTAVAPQYQSPFSALSQFSDLARTFLEMRQLQQNIEESKSRQSLNDEKALTEGTQRQFIAFKQGDMIEARKIQRQNARHEFVRLMQNLHDEGSSLSDLVSEFDMPEFNGNPLTFGLKGNMRLADKLIKDGIKRINDMKFDLLNIEKDGFKWLPPEVRPLIQMLHLFVKPR